jgi:hypothetical protein
MIEILYVFLISPMSANLCKTADQRLVDMKFVSQEYGSIWCQESIFQDYKESAVYVTTAYFPNINFKIIPFPLLVSTPIFYW